MFVWLFCKCEIKQISFPLNLLRGVWSALLGCAFFVSLRLGWSSWFKTVHKWDLYGGVEVVFMLGVVFQQMEVSEGRRASWLRECGRVQVKNTLGLSDYLNLVNPQSPQALLSFMSSSAVFMPMLRIIKTFTKDEMLQSRSQSRTHINSLNKESIALKWLKLHCSTNHNYGNKRKVNIWDWALKRLVLYSSRNLKSNIWDKTLR